MRLFELMNGNNVSGTKGNVWLKYMVSLFEHVFVKPVIMFSEYISIKIPKS